MAVPSSERLAFAGLAALLAGASLAAGAVGWSFYSRFAREERQAALYRPPPVAIGRRVVTVSMRTTVAPGFAWSVRPLQPPQPVHVGAVTLAFVETHNRAARVLVGHVQLAIQPSVAAPYFHRVDCLCLAEQRLAPGQVAQVPVMYYLDPALATDPAAAGVRGVTLSYAFSPSLRPQAAMDLAPSGLSPPDAARGHRLFAQRCAACHALAANGIGPALAGVLGRPAGAAPGFAYSPAMVQSARAAQLVWTEDALDRFLANPQAELPGTAMPQPVTTAASRQDILAYLAQPG